MRKNFLLDISKFIDDPELIQAIFDEELSQSFLPQISDSVERQLILLWAYYRVKSTYNF